MTRSFMLGSRVGPLAERSCVREPMKHSQSRRDAMSGEHSKKIAAVWYAEHSNRKAPMTRNVKGNRSHCRRDGKHENYRR